jgi:hypothetical protein
MASMAVAVTAGPTALRFQRPARPIVRPMVRPARPLHRTVPLQRPLAQQQFAWLPTGILALKLLAAVIAGAGISMTLWKDDWNPITADTSDNDVYDPALYSSRQASRAYRRERSPVQWEPSWADRGVILNFPRRVQTVKFTPPTRQAAAPPLTNPLAGKPLRYLIGTDAAGSGRDDEVTMVSYNAAAPVKRGISIAYGNLFDERNTGRYGPYLHTSDTAAQYGEGQIDPRGPGWEKNLREQYERRKKQGFEYIELDNPDAYSAKDVIGAIDLAATYGLKVIAKNPLLVNGAAAYVAHPNVVAAIVEKGAGNPAQMDALRRKAGKPNLPVWFVAFGSGRSWAGSVASSAKQFRHMGVTYSSAGEYGNSIDILSPGREG